MTTIEYQLPQSADVLLTIYDIQGHIVRRLLHEEKSAGKHTVQWDASQYASGVYYYKLQVGTNQLTETKKLILMK